ncbi:hypothetical protein SESBI_16460 [Sesbania bispinosa]|nr:hypothetical protein SESBI_16460 [Sesbania bispinosa]
MERRRITLILHHRGSFVREMGEVKYVGGEFCIWEGLDVDTGWRTMGSDDYESAEDSVYRPSPHVSDGDESIDQVPLSRKRVASSAEKRKGVSVSARRKKGKKVGGSGEGVSVPALSEEEEIHDDEQQPEEDEFIFGDYEQPEEDELFLGASLGTRSRFMQFIPTPPGPSTTGPRPRGPPPTGKPK